MFTRQKRCRYCRGLFRPDARVKNQQIACRKASCRKARKKEAQEKWVKKNPGYFAGRYPNTRAWLKRHPDYLQSYRESHPEYVQRNRIRQKLRRVRHKEADRSKAVALGKPAAGNVGVDIQDAIIAQPVVRAGDRRSLVSIDIQDTISTQLIVPVYIRRILPPVDIQDEMDRVRLSQYTGTRSWELFKRFVLKSTGQGGR